MIVDRASYGDRKNRVLQLGTTRLFAPYNTLLALELRLDETKMRGLSEFVQSCYME